MREISKTNRMRQIRDEVVNLKESPLYDERIKNGVKPVLGEGNHDADIMFIGEAPGKNEAETGRPFCGAAGRILDELLEHIGIERKDVYITNVVKDRPTNNRDPLPSEIEIYAPFLDRQIESIEPKIIATLGRYSMEYIMKKYDLDLELASISRIHGKVFTVKVPFGELKVVPMYHPAAAIYRQELKETLKEDFMKLKELL